MLSRSRNLKLPYGSFSSFHLGFFCYSYKAQEALWSFNKYKILIKKCYWRVPGISQRVDATHIPFMQRMLWHPSIKLNLQMWRWKCTNILYMIMWCMCAPKFGWGSIYFFLLFSLFTLFSLSKYRCVLSFILYIQFSPHSFYYYIFFLSYFDWYFFFNFIIVIYFNLIFKSNLVLILFIFLMFFYCIFPNLIPWHFFIWEFFFIFSPSIGLVSS